MEAAMNSVGTHEAKTQLSKLLERVARGERFTITRHGRPVARLVPPDRTSGMSAEEAVSELKSIRKGCTLGGISLREMVEDGRRF